IHDRQSLNLARPDGPRLSFGIGRHDGAVGQLPPTLEAVPVIGPPWRFRTGGLRGARRRDHRHRLQGGR
ncbi:hypothetical protein, partial [Mycobacterium paraintracellulare]|uniref:hypothetical protein n=1 Tax=Mycobacterium paraintracellulare TaxID=1138383 RepID=UPI001F43B03B